jgi:hypothetical protein
MSSAPVISNASPLIALEQIGHLDLLKGLFSAVLIPPAVVREIAPTVTPSAWVSERVLTQPIGPQILRATLGLGESEAISLALEIGAQWVILDERPARRLAQALGLSSHWHARGSACIQAPRALERHPTVPGRADEFRVPHLTRPLRLGASRCR